MPMPICTLSVSPWTMEMLSSGRPRRGCDELREGGLVTPWPWLCEPVSTSIVPTALTRTSADFPETDAGAERADRSRRRDAAGFDIAQLMPMPRFLPRRSASALRVGKPAQSAFRHGRIQRGLEVAGVVIHDDRRLVRELADEVDRAQLSRGDPQFTGRRLHRAFQQIGGFRTAGTTIASTGAVLV